jgi:hypothetical protein
MEIKRIQWDLREYGAVAGSCVHGGEPSRSIKGREFLD